MFAEAKLAARNADDDGDSGDSGAVPNGGEGGGEDTPENEDEGRDAGAGINIELLDVEDALSDAAAGSSCCVKLTATGELAETIHVPRQPTVYSFSRTTMAIAAREASYQYLSCDGSSAILNDRWPVRQTQLQGNRRQSRQKSNA